MSSPILEPVLLAVFAVLSLAAALFYRALRSASPTRLEEIHLESATHSHLPDVNDAVVSAGALKVFLYAAFVALLSLRLGARRGLEPSTYLTVPALSLAALLCFEALAFVVAGYQSGRALYRMLPLVTAFAAAGRSLSSAGAAVAGIVARLRGESAPPAPDEAAEEEMLDAVSEGTREGVIEDREREMIESILQFKDVEVSEIMTPRTELSTLSAEMGLEEMLSSSVETGHSRLPVWSETTDNIVGVLYVKDILQHVRPCEKMTLRVRSVMRTPYFVPETKRVRELLQEFRSTNVHMAIVLDEYGGTSGIVTIEDILEEIVGNIEDEFDEYQPPEIRLVGPDRAIAAACAEVEDVNDALGCELSESEEYETIAGYILFHLGRIPGIGEVFTWEGVTFRVLEADERRIKWASLELASDSETREGA